MFTKLQRNTFELEITAMKLDLQNPEVKYIILDSHNDRHLVKLAHAHPNWVVDYHDTQSIIFKQIHLEEKKN
jgi:hypothetical protein